MSVRVVEDRSLCIQPDQVVKSDWIDIDCCKLGLHERMIPEAVEKKWRRLLQQGDAACWPPIVGHWEEGRFVVCDGRHEYVASLMLGRTRIYVAWLEQREEEGTKVWSSSKTLSREELPEAKEVAHFVA